jgi:hypothetical protein
MGIQQLQRSWAVRCNQRPTEMARVFAMGYRHPRESGGPGQPLQSLGPWIPAFAGMTNKLLHS